MYQLAEKKYWEGRTDYTDGAMGLRWHQILNQLDLTQSVHKSGAAKNVALLGFCSDEGVRRNKGRLGAQLGPDQLRKSMASLPVHFDQEKLGLFDAGNIICPNQQLERSQQLLGQKVASLLSMGFLPVVMGGGHEVAYGHYLGLHQHLHHEQRSSLGILNIDAHFDLRTYEVETSSGTPFRQIADLRKHHSLPFHYLCMGIQHAGNTRALFDTAHRLNTKYVLAEDMRESQWEDVRLRLRNWMHDKEAIYLTIDLDAIAAAHAPGVSAPTPFGLDPWVVRLILQEVVQSGKLLSLDIAELSPALDQDGRTAKLAAQLVFALLDNLNNQLV
ncbi:formimidoylglutamase [Cesiribacter andamanensis]|uniref:Formimidoylglutamase n=1 Tax=Cesiribacter andamanensis AMV16 TaxID=1279009 RepID=M7MYR5_9BACT|nr:formimidoylglutamase [Cesiribacter andamanensis]EMR01603.1 Formimidoylglutamase [Cesiribacter andamanensis AMV16]